MRLVKVMQLVNLMVSSGNAGNKVKKENAASKASHAK